MSQRPVFAEHAPGSPLSVHSLTVAYDHRPVLWDVEYDAPNASLVAIVGPNGAGKSTLMKAALALVPLAAGEVRFWGKPFKEVRDRVAYVPQRESVEWDFPISALDVVAMGTYRRLGWFRRVGAKERALSMRCLDRLGIADLGSRQISELSGGQQQRVFLARALAQDAELYLMDEPLTGVDAATEESIIRVLRDLRSQGRTVLAVHHDLSTVPAYFDHVLMINGRVVSAGTVQQAFTPETLRTTYAGRLTPMERAAHALSRMAKGSTP